MESLIEMDVVMKMLTNCEKKEYTHLAFLLCRIEFITGREMQKKICAMVAGVSEKESKIRLKKAEGKLLW